MGVAGRKIKRLKTRFSSQASASRKLYSAYFFEKGCEALKDGDVKSAKELLMRSINRKNPHAAFKLGEIHNNKSERYVPAVAQDYFEESIELYLKNPKVTAIYLPAAMEAFFKISFEKHAKAPNNHGPLSNASTLLHACLKWRSLETLEVIKKLRGEYETKVEITKNDPQRKDELKAYQDILKIIKDSLVGIELKQPPAPAHGASPTDAEAHQPSR